MTDHKTPLVHIMAQLINPQPGYRNIFTYDLLMHEDGFLGRCPGSWFVTTARLLNQRWIVNQDGIPTIERRVGSFVYGVIWEISEEEQAQLEIELGIPGCTDRFGAFARGPSGDMIATEYYASTNHRHGTAEPIDIVQVLAVAHELRFPDSYLTEISGWGRRCAKSTERPV